MAGRDVESWDRMLKSMWVCFGLMPRVAPGGRALELDGVIASIVPSVPERSLPNSVLYREEDDLIAALDELASTYAEAGIQAWTVWVPGYHERAKAALAEAGHTLDATPEAMIADLAEVEPPRDDDPEPAAEPRQEQLGVVNDLAYATGDSFQRLLGKGPADPRFTYLAGNNGDPLASVVSLDHAGDCSIWWVATVPEARGRGLAPGLMRHALADGRDRGCDVSTLQATKLGRPVYERLGYRALGSLEMWELRSA